MKKQELCAALEQIRPDEELICRTLDKIQMQNAKKKRSVPDFVFRYQMACAMCALFMVIGVSLFAVKYKLNSSADLQNSTPGNIKAYTLEEESSSADDTSAGVSTSAFVIPTRMLTPNVPWVMLKGSVNTIYFRSVNEGTYHCSVVIHVSEVLDKASDKEILPVPNDDILAEIVFTNEAAVNSFADSAGREICVVLTSGNGDNASPDIFDYQLIK